MDFDYEAPDGCWYESRLSYLQIAKLGFCGCGDPDAVTGYVVDIMGRIRDKKWDTFRYEDLPTMFFLYWLDEKGYAEHGTTVRCCWLTEGGEALLIDLERELATPAARKAEEE
jgi:hypothetical protein